MATKPNKPNKPNRGKVASKTAPAESSDYRTASINVPMPAVHTSADYAAAVARKLAMPEVNAAAVIEKWQSDTHNVNALVTELQQQVQAVNGGDLRRAESMLIAQAHTLDNIFANLARRATTQQYLPQWEAYMRMAMKAQAQCRSTLETLANIKNPPVVFARQANINNGGQQQVNNGVANYDLSTPGAPGNRAGTGQEGANALSRPIRACVGAHAEESAIKQTELLETSDVQRMDTGAAGAAGDADPHMATVGALDRATHRRG